MKPFRSNIVLLLLAIILGGSVVYLIFRPSKPRFSTASKPSIKTNQVAPQVRAAANAVNNGSNTLARASTNTTGFQLRPFPVDRDGTVAQWTAADGKDTNVIRQLAHNDLEYDRMVDENQRIFRRQLVYLKETAASVFEKAKLTGGPVEQLTLPGIDGQELKFDIVKRQAQVSSRQGMFSGHLAGNNDSLVTLAFEDGRQAFTILSPKENIFIVGEPREDGQVIVKAIDPNTYGVGPANADDTMTNQPTNK